MVAIFGLLYYLGIIGFLISPITNRGWNSEVAQKICDRPVNPHATYSTALTGNTRSPEVGEIYAFTDTGCSFTYLDTNTRRTIYSGNLTATDFAGSGTVRYITDGVEDSTSGSLNSLFHHGSLVKKGFLNVACCKRFVYDFGLKYGPYSKVSELQLSPNGRDFAYIGADFEGGHLQVVVNGQAGTLYDILAGIHFALDSRTLWYYACDGRACYKVTRSVRR
ncbi:MAG: hypothetical protein JWN14_153 [Chthonomonadales bacterium]|nr:hypothetical protein [Chthonomonadales bacterium]